MAPMAARKLTLYEILGIPPDALPVDIGLAYDKRLAQLQESASQDTNTIALLRQAREVLSNPKRRAAYDATLVAESEKAAAKEQAAAPDLVVEPGEEEAPERRRIPPALIALGVAVLVIAAYFAFRSPERAAPPPVAEAPAEAPQAPPPPPAPKPKPAKDILAQAQRSVGRLQSFEMSGRAVPLGLAIALEPSTMVTTCHGIPGGAQLAVSVGPETHSASLAVTDETLDLGLQRLSAAFGTA